MYVNLPSFILPSPLYNKQIELDDLKSLPSSDILLFRRRFDVPVLILADGKGSLSEVGLQERVLTPWLVWLSGLSTRL